MYALTLPFLVGCSSHSSGDDGASVVSAPQPTAVPDDATGPPGSAVSDDGAAQVDPATGGSVNGPVDATALEQTVVAFASCVGDRTVIRIRFRSDPYVGLSYAIESPEPEVGPAAEQECAASANLDAVVSRYLADHPLAPADEQLVVDRFAACAANLVAGPDLSALHLIRDIDDLQQRIGGTLEQAQGEALNTCKLDAVFGTERTFGG